jgi:hypothetical protein
VADRGIEQRAFLVAHIHQHGLLGGKRIDGGQHVVDVTASRIGADLAGPDEVGHADREAPERRTQEWQPPFQGDDRQPMRMAQRDGLRCCPRVCPCQIILPVKLARMFAMALRCTTTDGGPDA